MGGTIGFQRGGNVSMRNVTVKTLIEIAYGVEEYRISGGPAWVTSAGHDVDAKPEAPVDEGQARLLLQALLADRFALRVHHETITTAGYRLVVDKGGSKLRNSATERHGFQVVSLQEIRGPGDTGDLARALKAVLGAPVEDGTGFAGNYEIELKWDSDSAPAMPSATVGAGPGAAASEPATSIFTALKQQMGLRLETTKAPVDRVVIDSVARPTDN
jgi:uncharacterized protein (TIGR03435 family)